MVRLAAAAETWLGKPVIAINTATYWHALRQNKIMDKMSELGRLLSNSELLFRKHGVRKQRRNGKAAHQQTAQD